MNGDWGVDGGDEITSMDHLTCALEALNGVTKRARDAESKRNTVAALRAYADIKKARNYFGRTLREIIQEEIKKSRRDDIDKMVFGVRPDSTVQPPE